MVAPPVQDFDGAFQSMVVSEASTSIRLNRRASALQGHRDHPKTAITAPLTKDAVAIGRSRARVDRAANLFLRSTLRGPHGQSRSRASSYKRRSSHKDRTDG